MANRNIKVIGHWVDSNGKHMSHLGSSLQFSMNVATIIGTDGQERVDPAQVQSKLSAAGKVPSGGTFVITSYGSLDSYEVPNGIL